jgi:hypothetical protein
MDRNFSSNMCFACDSTFRYWTSSTFYIEVSNSIQKLRTTSYYNRLYLDVGVYQSNSKLKIIYIKEILLAFCLCDFPSGSIRFSTNAGSPKSTRILDHFFRRSSGHIFEIHVDESPTFRHMYLGGLMPFWKGMGSIKKWERYSSECFWNAPQCTWSIENM